MTYGHWSRLGVTTNGQKYLFYEKLKLSVAWSYVHYKYFQVQKKFLLRKDSLAHNQNHEKVIDNK